jgi:hypothetical protein
VSGLMPREHGAYAQLAFPLVTGLILARGDGGAVSFAVAAVALFLVHEPAAVLAGVRGKRLQESLGPAARRRLPSLLAAAALAGVAAVGLAPPRAWIGAAIPAGLAVVMVPFFLAGRIKSLPGEVVAAAAFSTAVVPMALCHPTAQDSVVWGRALVAAGVWYGAIIPAILTVHAIKAGLKGRPGEQWTRVAAPAAAVLVLVAAVAGAVLFPPPARDLLAVVPPALASLAISLRLPHPRHLKRVGWAVVASQTLALVLLVAL